MIQIHPADAQDAEALAIFAEQVFRETFAADNTPEDLDLYTQSAFSFAHQAREILDPERHTVLARRERQLVGYYQLRMHHADRSVELVRLYVDKAFHGQGVAKRLMQDVVSRSEATGYPQLWLGVWEFNFRAQAFYRKHGFAVTGSHAFVLGRDAQRDFIMTRSLKD